MPHPTATATATFKRELSFEEISRLIEKLADTTFYFVRNANPSGNGYEIGVRGIRTGSDVRIQASRDDIYLYSGVSYQTVIVSAHPWGDYEAYGMSNPSQDWVDRAVLQFADKLTKLAARMT
jgi:hypothetical protein